MLMNLATLHLCVANCICIAFANAFGRKLSVHKIGQQNIHRLLMCIETRWRCVIKLPESINNPAVKWYSFETNLSNIQYQLYITNIYLSNIQYVSNIQNKTIQKLTSYGPE